MTTYYVDEKWGDDSLGTGTKARPWQSLSRALSLIPDVQENIIKWKPNGNPVELSFYRPVYPVSIQPADANSPITNKGKLSCCRNLIFDGCYFMPNLTDEDYAIVISEPFRFGAFWLMDCECQFLNCTVDTTNGERPASIIAI